MRCTITIMLLFFVHASHAQDVDSLWREFNRTSSKDRRAALLYRIGIVMHDRHNEGSAISYASRAFMLAKETSNDSLAMHAAALLGNATKRSGSAEHSLGYFDTAINYARKLKRPADEMQYLEHSAYAQKSLGHHYLSLDKFDEALKIAIASHNKAQEAYYCKVMASEFATSDDYGPVLELINRSIHIYDSLKEPVKSADNYMELEIMYSKQEKYGEALRIGWRVDSIYNNQHDTERAQDNRINIAVTYKNMGAFDNAIEIYRSYLTMPNIDDFGRIVVLHNLAVALSGKGDYNEAQKYFLQAAEINRTRLKEAFFDISNYKEMASAALKAHKLDTALHYALLGEKQGRSGDIESNDYRTLLWLLSDIHAALGDFDKAHQYDRQYIALNDTINHHRHSRAMAEAETRLHLADKEREVDILAVENQKKTQLTIVLFIGLVLVGFAAILIVRIYRRTLKKNALLSEQKNIIDEQVAQLAVAASMKSRFFANISHELRTPITLLTGMLELLKDKKPTDPAKEKETLEIAYNNSVKLQRMIEEILDLARQEGHPDMKPRIHVREVAPLLGRIIAPFKTYAQQQGLQLQYQQDTKDAYMAVDEDKLEKIINNLVYNATKFNQPGGAVNVRASLSSDKQHIIITVSNTGKGISPADLPHIFDRYYQGADSGAKTRGLGIGLSLVREFTTLLGGTITATSDFDGLTTFTLQFPAVGRDMEEVLQQETTVPAEDWKPSGALQTVLVVEDNAEMRFYIREILSGNMIVLEAESGSAALTLLLVHTPDLIISDMMMPEMDGPTFVSKLKECPKMRLLPVIMLTALADKETQLNMLRMGVDDYIVKPFNAEELRIRVGNLLLNFAERKVFNEQPAEEGDIELTSKETEDFRSRLTECVLSRLKYTNVSVADIAHDMAVSERQLFRLAKSLTGCSPAQLIKEVRLQKAYELLVNGEVYKIEDLAHRVGFDNPGYFSRQFFERFGKRPTEML